MRKVNLLGKVFGRLTVVAEGGRKNGHVAWVCECSCGNRVEVVGQSLTTKKTVSCGCLKVERAEVLNRKHDKRYTRLYSIYLNMKQRCCNPKSPSYKYYGGRGIKICDEWLNDFMSFYNWAMRHGYRRSLTIDRINNDGNYSPLNCRWATSKEQNNNRRNVRIKTTK